jgi:hypothetical protein
MLSDATTTYSDSHEAPVPVEIPKARIVYSRPPETEPALRKNRIYEVINLAPKARIGDVTSRLNDLFMPQMESDCPDTAKIMSEMESLDKSIGCTLEIIDNHLYHTFGPMIGRPAYLIEQPSKTYFGTNLTCNGRNFFFIPGSVSKVTGECSCHFYSKDGRDDKAVHGKGDGFCEYYSRGGCRVLPKQLRKAAE